MSWVRSAPAKPWARVSGWAMAPAAGSRFQCPTPTGGSTRAWRRPGGARGPRQRAATMPHASAARRGRPGPPGRRSPRAVPRRGGGRHAGAAGAAWARRGAWARPCAWPRARALRAGTRPCTIGATAADGGAAAATRAAEWPDWGADPDPKANTAATAAAAASAAATAVRRRVTSRPRGPDDARGADARRASRLKAASGSPRRRARSNAARAPAASPRSASRTPKLEAAAA